MKHLFSTALAFVVASFAGFAQCEADHVVEASSFMYAPSMLTIEQGESVAFVNLGGTHDVNGDVDSQTGMSFGNPEAFYLDAVSGAPEESASAPTPSTCPARTTTIAALATTPPKAWWLPSS